MFVFIKKIFCIKSLFWSSLVRTTPLSCISIKNQECKVRPEIVDIISNNSIIYSFSIKINKCSGSCNNIKVFNLMSRTNETTFIKWHETCTCIWRLDEIICNSKERWNENKCICECKELIDKGTCDKGFVLNPRNCECECDKSCNIGQYLDYSDFFYTEKYDEVFSGIISEIKTINGRKELFYEKNYAKIGVNTDDHIPLNKQSKFPTLTTIIRCVFQNGKKLYPQIYLDDCLYESI